MKKILNLISGGLILAGFLSVISCEDDISNVGSNMLDDGTSADYMYVDVISYNQNLDSIRSDEKVLQNGIVGVYEEPVFGRTKARFISQVRMGTPNPSFGNNPVVDSVLLTIPVFYNSTPESVDTIKKYIAPEGSTNKDTLIIKKTYKIDSLYGNTALPMTLQVREVAQYLQAQDSILYSNPNLGSANNNIQVYPQVLGSTQIRHKVTTEQVFVEGDANEQEPTPAYIIKLDKEFFKQKFLDNQGSSNLADQAAFIRNLFRGIELSVAEDQGFFFNFNPNLMDITMYYTRDNTSSTSETTPRVQNKFNLTFSSTWATIPGSNVQVNQFQYANRSSEVVQAYAHPNINSGDKRLYLNGLDGSRSIVKINQEQLNQIKQNVIDNNWVVIGAELEFHIDESYNLKKPPYLFAWHAYKKDNKVKEESFTDLIKFYNSYPNEVHFNPRYDFKNDPKIYKIRITDYIKGIVEGKETYEDGKLVLGIGNFLMAPTAYTTPVNSKAPYLNNRAFNPYRIVLHGSASEQAEKALKLKIYYTKK